MATQPQAEAEAEAEARCNATECIAWSIIWCLIATVPATLIMLPVGVSMLYGCNYDTDVYLARVSPSGKLGVCTADLRYTDHRNVTHWLYNQSVEGCASAQDALETTIEGCYNYKTPEKLKHGEHNMPTTSYAASVALIATGCATGAFMCLFCGCIAVACCCHAAGGKTTEDGKTAEKKLPDLIVMGHPCSAGLQVDLRS